MIKGRTTIKTKRSLSSREQKGQVREKGEKERESRQRRQ